MNNHSLKKTDFEHIGSSTILVTGATGFLGRRVCRLLDGLGVSYTKTSLSLGCDLRNTAQSLDLFTQVRPAYVLNCAAYVGGIQFGCKYPGELFKNNLLITLNLLDGCRAVNVRKLINPISNCAYPSKATLFREDEFWDGPLHETVMTYGFVRKASWVGAWSYARQYGLDVLNIILSNMYGPEDHFDEERSHALGALIMKFVEANQRGHPEVVVWGSGRPVREWLHVDDGAEAMVRGISVATVSEPVNIGVGKGISIIKMAEIIKDIIGYSGNIVLDESKPDGAPYKTVDGSRGEQLFGWKPTRGFRQGVGEVVDWYMANRKDHNASC